MREAEFRHPRLVTVYDAECPWSRDDDFFLAVVNETPCSRVLDLGCGTGRLALGMAAAGHTVTGVDPARASLEAARAKTGAERVTWLEGTSPILPDAAFDVAVMTSHVAQFLVDDDAWAATLADLRRALVPGGRLVFDTRDPRARAWERWNPVASRRRIALPDGSEVVAWTEVTAVGDGAVGFTHHYTFPDGASCSAPPSCASAPRTRCGPRCGVRDSGSRASTAGGTASPSAAGTGSCSSSPGPDLRRLSPATPAGSEGVLGDVHQRVVRRLGDRRSAASRGSTVGAKKLRGRDLALVERLVPGRRGAGLQRRLGDLGLAQQQPADHQVAGRPAAAGWCSARPCRRW